ncbi:hypothetical protein LSUE1_G005687 [Lachnellula suecica]|uniref:Asteroid domain-containing protein n=1 Tax=Lachnellula suecica TaxID=602035 RepID=A0A8T9C616_9HELO|nr:hypothetical protein LSUE1_G005687 [Lachnellula suecica]
MGIPHLTRHLRPYAVSESLSGREIVIDGPGFAYHVYNICLSGRTEKNQFETAISYEQIGVFALAWLNTLRKGKVTIRTIYFDGSLPPSKREVRIDRLVRNTKQLLQYHQAHPTPCQILPKKEDHDLRNLFARSSVRPALKCLPAPPFLVPAVLEALRASGDFQAVTEVIPGEADEYCAQSVKVNGGVILTGDSDLLLHDLGAEGAVLFFNDVEVGSNDVPTGQVFHPLKIADRIGLKAMYDLHSLAFEMTMNPTLSLPQILVKSTTFEAVNAYTLKFAQFQRDYVSHTAAPSYRPNDLTTLEVLRTLDPRISEFVLQYSSIAKVAGQPQEYTISDAAHIFIPFLLDCPTRTNSWEMSMGIRQLAYGLVSLIVPKSERKATIFEHKRQEGKSGGRELSLPEVPQIQEACSDLVDLLSSKLPSKLLNTADMSQPDIWTAAAIYQDVEWSHYNSKACVSQLATQQPTSADPRKLTWDAVHLHAQIQGSHYSFRILQQITALVTSRKANYNLPPQLLELQKILQTLPPLSSIPDITQAPSLLIKIREHGMLDAAQTILGIPLPELRVNKAEKAEKKRKRGKETVTEQVQPTNPYELLGVE